jgi:hypothetical protein
VSEATRALEKAVRCAEHLPADRRLSKSLHALAFLYREQGKHRVAASLYLRVIGLWQKMGAAGHDGLTQSLAPRGETQRPIGWPVKPATLRDAALQAWT